MAVRVQCPHCGAVCQIQEQHVGSNATCGKCAKVFTTRRPAAASTPTASSATPPVPGESAASAPPPSGPTPPAVSSTPAKRTLGGLWSGMQSLFHKGKKPGAAVPNKDTSPGDAGDIAMIPDDEIGLDLDGPSAEALRRQEETEKQRPPRLGMEPAALHGQFRLDLGACTSMGRVRDRNEDSYLLWQQSWSNLEGRHDAALVVVADGMGGHHAGDRASLLTLQQVGTALRPVLTSLGPTPPDQKPVSFRDALEASLRAANSVVYQIGQKEAAGRGMGATAAVVLIWDGQVEIGHVGDCRVYVSHEGNVSQVTKDQTLVARMVELGQLSEQEARNHPKANEVIQAIGKNPDLQPAYYKHSLVPGDWLIVACDGLHAHVDLAALGEVLHAAPLGAGLVAHHLVDLVNFRGGTDNCTVVAVRCY